MFAVEHSGVVPDLIAMAKSIASGLPLGAVTGRADVMDAPGPGGLGGTFAGNPVACAAALAVLDVFREEHLVARAADLGERVRKRLLAARTRHSWIGDVRGLGAMQAIELVAPDGEPDAARAGAVQREALDRGVLVLTAGTFGNVIRLLMPLTIPFDVLDEGFAALDAALDAAGRAA
jgi:4-aminobutyrate aminotransferase-like enzyme